MTEPAIEAAPPLTRLVLVVEDDDDVRRLICRLLALYGYTTVDSSNGVGAFAHLRLTPPDVVLLDMMLPGGVSGFDVVRRMREHERWRDIPVIPMTAAIDLDDQIAALQPRFVLRKPFRVEDLLGVVLAALDEPDGQPNLAS